MADKHIDQDETQIYGHYASKRIRKLAGRIPAFDAALDYIANQLDTSSAAVRAAVDSARKKDAAIRSGAQGKTPLVKQGKKLLGRFSKHLAGHPEGAVDRKVFFTKDGTATGVGSGAQDILLAITHITTELADTKSPVRDRAAWHAEFNTMLQSFAPVVAFSDDARIDRQSLTPEVEAARQAWLNTYLSAKSLAESVLRQLGRLEHMPLYFYDLRVPAGAKVTEMPAEPPEEPADEGDEAEADEA